MRLIHIGSATLNQTPLDWDGNQANIVAALREARARGVELLCLPELCVSGYGCEDAFLGEPVAATALAVLRELVPETAGIAAAIGLPLLVGNALYNAVAVCVDGCIVGFAAKQNLAGDGLHYEPRWFRAWPRGAVATVAVGDQVVPVGDLVFDVGGVRVGFEICEDAWVANRPGAALAARGVDVLMNPSASHFAFGKFPVRRAFVSEGARAFGVTYVYSNLVGNEAGRAIYDGGALIASAGELVAQGPRFSFAPWSVTSAVVDVAQTRRRARAAFNANTAVDAAAPVTVPFTFAAHAPPAAPPLRPSAWERSDHVREEEFARAEALALFDYLRKTGARGYVLSLSGGADSSSVACLVAAMVELGCAELGATAFARALRIDAGGPDISQRALVGALLTCVYQPTRNSGDVTLNAARGLAESLGAAFHVFDVDPIVAAYVALAEGALGRPLTWERDDLALQNIQARARGPSVWMLANLKNALLLATSNRSEASVGYATMDGDTCGGISPLGGINKAWLLSWLRWLQTKPAPAVPLDLAPVPALAAVTAQAPTAELRPTGAAQTDEGDLMPYPVLDAIERAAIRDKLLPADAARRVAAQFPQQAASDVDAWVGRFYRLWCRSQWKRERYAPAFHVDDENVDPKTWCRFPILNGGYARELRGLAPHTDQAP